MNLGIIGTILALVSGVVAYIVYLKGLIEKHATESMILKNRLDTQEWKKEIDEAVKRVNETEIDYKRQRDAFHDKYGTGDSKPK
jgi:hypothetical protein